MSKKVDWLSEFDRIGARKTGEIWKMASGKYSGVNFDMWRLYENPDMYSRACNALLRKSGFRIVQSPDTWIIGPERDGIAMALELARQSGTHAAFTSKTMFSGAALKEFKLLDKARVLLVTDVITTGSSLVKVAAAIQQSGGTIVRKVLTFVNRSNLKKLCLFPHADQKCNHHEFDIISLVEVNEPGWSCMHEAMQHSRSRGEFV